MRRYTWFICLTALLAWACGDDDGDLRPSNGERNWLVVEDNPNSPIDHQRYLIFEETGIPVYYNDTIGSEERYSVVSGDCYTYYEVLQVFYSPGSATPSEATAHYSLVADTNDLVPVLDFLETDVLPQIPESIYVPSILLVDSLTTPTGDSLAYKGTNTIVLSKVCDFEDMDEASVAQYRGTFLATLVANSIYNMESEWLEENFYAVTYAVNPTNVNSLYSTATNSIAVYRACSGMDLATNEQTLAVLGFIWGRPMYAGAAERSWYVPTKSQDVLRYCIEILSYTEAEFTERHGDDEVVMEKYRVMREKLEEYGFSIE